MNTEMNRFDDADIRNAEDKSAVIKKCFENTGRNNIISKRGYTLLYYAVFYKSYDIVKYLLRNGENPDIVMNYCTLAIFRLRYNPEVDTSDIEFKLLKVLVKYGANINTKTETCNVWYTPLSTAEYYNNEKMVEFLKNRPKIDTLYRMCLGVIRNKGVNVPKWVPEKLLWWRL
jgi:ankyrin repeat protein